MLRWTCYTALRESPAHGRAGIAPPLQRLFVRSDRGSLAVASAIAAIVFTLLATAGLTLLATRTDALMQSQQKLQIAALTLEQNIAQKIDAIDLSIRAVQARLAIPGLDAMDPDTRRAFVYGGPIDTIGVIGIDVTDEHGTVVGSSNQPFVPRNLADRSCFPILKASPDAGLIVSEPVRLRSTGNWGLVFARRLNHPDGSFAGVVVAGFELAYFDELFSAMDLGPQAVITLFKPQGDVLARWPHLPQGPGAGANLSSVIDRMDPAPKGFITGVSPLDHVHRLFAYSRFGEYPLMLTVGIPIAEVFSSLYARSVVLSGIVIILTLCGAILSWRVWHELRRRVAAELRSDSERQTARALLDRMQALFSASPDSMLIAQVAPNGDWVYEAVNPVWESLTGVSAEAAIGRRPADILPPTTAKRVLDIWQQSATEGLSRFTLSSPRPNDLRLWEALIVPVKQPVRRAACSRSRAT